MLKVSLKLEINLNKDLGIELIGWANRIINWREYLITIK